MTYELLIQHCQEKHNKQYDIQVVTKNFFHFKDNIQKVKQSMIL